MKLVIRRAVLAVAICTLGVACGKVASSGGETHWLGNCNVDSDCQRGACLCGICTETCTGDETCLASANGSACYEVASPGVQARCAGASPKNAKGICLATCASSRSCASGTECIQGACVRSTTSLGTKDTDASGVGGATATSSDAAAPFVGGTKCYVPSNELPMGTPEEQNRAELIHAFCVNLGKNGCLPFSAGSSFIGGDRLMGCSTETLIHGCELDVAYEYAQSNGICDAEWQNAMTCAAAASYTTDACSLADLGRSVAGRALPCQTQKDAYVACGKAVDSMRVIGSRTSCQYNQGIVSPCRVSCADGTNNYSLDCGGPVDLPLRCMCGVNGHVGDLDFGGLAEGSAIYATDCGDAARRAANGVVCTNRLDCCVKYTSSGIDECICGADPGELGFATCAELAASKGGQVVASCPQYEDSSSNAPQP